jgi:hypothetical protein
MVNCFFFWFWFDIVLELYRTCLLLVFNKHVPREETSLNKSVSVFLHSVSGGVNNHFGCNLCWKHGKKSSG